MPAIRTLTDDEVARIYQLYSDAETEILNEINKGLMKGNKLSYLQTMLQNCQAIINDLMAGSQTWCEEAMPDVYMDGLGYADEQIIKAGGKVIAGFGAIHQQAAEVLAVSLYARFEDVGKIIGRQVNDIYRQMTLENIKGSAIGYKSWQQAAKGIKDSLDANGVTGFKDKKDRKWNMRSYAQMAARTSTMEAHLMGTANRLLEHGHDLVKISRHSGSCPKCDPWQGKVVSLTGKTKGYPTLEEARAKGLFHPNCRHAYGVYLPELD